MSSVRDLNKPFAEVYEALDEKAHRKAMRGAMRRVGNMVKKSAAQSASASGLRNGAQVAKGLRVRVYPDRFGLGFMVSTKPRGKKGYYKNRQGKEKPVLMWAAEGTKQRTTRSKSKWFVRKKRGHSTGRMPAFGFMEKTENREAGNVEANLFDVFEKNLEKAVRKLK